MNQAAFEVEIRDGKIIPLHPERLPETGRGVLTISTPGKKRLPLWRPDEFPARCMARKAGIDAGKFVVPDDFNDPLPDEFWGF